MAGGGGGADVVVALLPASRSAAFALGLALGAAAGGVLAAITTRRMLDSAKSKSTTSTRPNDQPLVLAIETLTDAVRGLAQTYDADRQAAKLNGSRYQSHAGGSFESASLSSSSSTQLGTDGFRTPLEDAAWDEEPAEDEFYDARSRSNSSAASVVAQARHLATGAAPAAGENDDDVEAMEVAAAAASDPRAFAAAVNGALRAQKVVGSSGEEIDATFYVKVDHARESKEFQSVFNMLKTAFDADASPTSVNRGQEVYWRYARAYFDLSTSHAAGSDERKRLVEAGLQLANEGLVLFDTSAMMHKWFAILVTAVAEFGGAKERIATAFTFRDHVRRAIELDPRDGSSYHLLGRWCFEVSRLKWYERKAAAALFGRPPEATVEEALELFLQAEAATPFFWRANPLFIGRCYKQSGKPADARTYFELALSDGFKVSMDDEETLVDARKELDAL